MSETIPIETVLLHQVVALREENERLTQERDHLRKRLEMVTVQVPNMADYEDALKDAERLKWWIAHYWLRLSKFQSLWCVDSVATQVSGWHKSPIAAIDAAMHETVEPN
jgi:hypothetical protein